MRMLVTGHDGYLGTAVVQRLRESGHVVAGLDTGLFTDCVLGPAPEPVPTFRTDLRDVGPEHCAGFDAVVHLAALSNDPLGDLNPGLTYDINHQATVRLATAAKAAGVSRFLFSSSCSLYGAGPGQAPLDENAEFSPLTPYGHSKVMSERSLGELADDSFSPVYLRNATAYGLAPRLRTDLVVNDLTARALLTGEITLLSDGTAWRPLVHVEDIAAAFAALAEAPRDTVHGKAFNVGMTSENYLIRDVAEIVRDAIPGSRVCFAPGSAPDRRSYRVSCDRIAREVPGFAPQWTLRKGIEQLAEGYLRHGLSAAEAGGDRYRRLKRIQTLRSAGRLDENLRWHRG